MLKLNAFLKNIHFYFSAHVVTWTRFCFPLWILLWQLAQISSPFLVSTLTVTVPLLMCQILNKHSNWIVISNNEREVTILDIRRIYFRELRNLLILSLMNDVAFFKPLYCQVVPYVDIKSYCLLLLICNFCVQSFCHPLFFPQCV